MHEIEPEAPRPLGWRGAGLLLLVALVHEAAISLGVMPEGGRVGWSHAGFVVALLALTSPRRWAVLLPIAVAINVVPDVGFGADPAAAGVLRDGVAFTLQGLLGALVLTAGARRVASLRSADDLVRLGVAVLLCGGVATATGLVGDPAGSDLAAEIFAHHTLSITLFAAMLLTWSERRRWTGHPLETASQLLVVTLALLVVVTQPQPTLPMVIAVIPLLIWAALRLDLRVLTGELLALAIVVNIGPIVQKTLLYRSLSADGDLEAFHAFIDSYLLCMALATLPLAISVGSRRALLARVAADAERFERHFGESPVGMLFLEAGPHGLVVDDANRAAAPVLGVAPEELVGTEVSRLLTGDRGLTDALLRGQVASRVSWRGEASATARPGSRLDVALTTVGVREGRRQLSLQLLDLTDTTVALQRLEAARRLTDITLDTTACVILVIDATGTVVRVNDATTRLTGHSARSLVGHRIWDTPLEVLTRPEVEAMFLWPNRSGVPIVRETASRSADGRWLRLVWSDNVVRDDHGLPTYAVLTGVDVTAERSTRGLVATLLGAAIATALIALDTHGRITVANSGAARLLGCRPEDLVGERFIDLLDAQQLAARTGGASRQAPFTALVGLIGHQGETNTQDWRWRARDDREVVVSMTLTVTEDSLDGEVGFLCVARDVTEQRAAQARVVDALEKERTAVERLQSLDRAKDEFVSTVSHELRTPITSIIGYTEILRDGTVVPADDRQLPMLETIARNGQRLIAICNDLLLLGGFESDAGGGAREEFDLRECLLVTEDQIRPQLRGRDLTLSVETGPEKVLVLGDRGQLDRVVANLVGNAVKFTPDGGRVLVRLQLLGEQAVLTVRDTGIGIDAADQRAIFTRFFRTEAAQRRAIPGTGLGLSIVASIVTAHDGTIDVDSAPDVGTTFRVLLPLAPRL
ncbi:ATP-binding protein [Nocardioides sp.]|uniref:ATP-binding protein n=1 Tax=Nocardioides sp. TaxID=35761 RepID=UPI0035175038